MQIAARACDIQQVLAVFPFFQADLSNRQQKTMHTLTRVPRVMGVVGAILGALPLAFQRWLVNWWGGTDHCHLVLLDSFYKLQAFQLIVLARYLLGVPEL